MEIPYALEPRPDTGMTNARMGIWLFLASEVMLFGGLFSAYALLRVSAVDWPDSASILNVPLATFNSVLLILSSVTLVFAWQALRRGDTSRFRMLFSLTLALGVAFLAIKGFEYRDKLEHGLLPRNSTFLATYWVLTGVHAVHLLAGVVVNLWLLFPGFKVHHEEPVRYAQRIETSGLYWHFVDLVWLLLFPVLYLL